MGVFVKTGDGVYVGVEKGVPVEVGIAVSTETTLAVSEQEVRIRAISKTMTIFVIFIHTFLCEELPNGLRTLRWGGDDEAVHLEKC